MPKSCRELFESGHGIESISWAYCLISSNTSASITMPVVLVDGFAIEQAPEVLLDDAESGLEDAYLSSASTTAASNIEKLPRPHSHYTHTCSPTRRPSALYRRLSSTRPSAVSSLPYRHTGRSLSSGSQHSAPVSLGDMVERCLGIEGRGRCRSGHRPK